MHTSSRTVASFLEEEGSELKNPESDESTTRIRAEDLPLFMKTETVSETLAFTWKIDALSLEVAMSAIDTARRHRPAPTAAAAMLKTDVELGGFKFRAELSNLNGGSRQLTEDCAFQLFTCARDDAADDGKEDFTARYTLTCGHVSHRSAVESNWRIGVGFNNFCSRAALKALSVENDGVSIEIEVERYIRTSRELVTPRPPAIAFQAPDKVLGQWLRQLPKMKELADVSLRCAKERRIKANKCVLAAVSPVFASMFRHEMVESATSVVNLTNWPFEAVECFIYFIYNGQLRADYGGSELMASASKKKKHTSDANQVMLEMADFFKVQPLAAAVCERMLSALRLETACELLLCCERYTHVTETRSVRKAVWNYIVEHISELKQTEPFRKLLRHPKLVSQLVDAVTR